MGEAALRQETCHLPPNPAVIPGLNPRFLRHHRVLPLAIEDGAVTLAMAEPDDALAAAGIAFAAGLPVRRTFLPAGTILAALDGTPARAAEPEGADAVRTVRRLLVAAVEAEAHALVIDGDAVRWQRGGAETVVETLEPAQARAARDRLVTQAEHGAVSLRLGARRLALPVTSSGTRVVVEIAR